MKITNETKIGILVFICIISLGVLTLKVGNFTFYKKRYNVFLSFQNVGGIKLHAPVRIAGVEVGEVTEIKPPQDSNAYRVILNIALDEGLKIRKDAKIFVTVLGLMGEKYIEITAGTPNSDFVKPGETIIGKDPLVMEELYQTIDAGVTEIKNLVANVNDIVVNNRSKLDNMISNLEGTSQNLEEFSADLKSHPWKLMYRAQDKK